MGRVSMVMSNATYGTGASSLILGDFSLARQEPIIFIYINIIELGTMMF